MQHDSNKWKSPLEASRGQLAPEKCSYYKTQWTFQANGKPKLELAKVTQNKDSILEVIIPIQTLHRFLHINKSPENQVSHNNQLIDKEKHILNIFKTKK
jgi:hypothetical protein